MLPIEPSTTAPFGPSASPAMQAVLSTLAQVADRDLPVLLHGEGGCGKGRLAFLLHAQSHRRAGPFVRIDCADLFDSSHAPKGRRVAAGEQLLRARLREAAKGTLLLREIGELPGRLQGLLLLHVRPPRTRAAARARIVATTHRDLQGDVAAGRFLEDLHFRLGVIDVEVPPLRRRPEDIPALALEFLEGFARAEGLATPELTDLASQALVSYAWPGNIRELRNAMQRGLVLCQDARFDLDALPNRVSAALGRPQP